MKLTKTNKKLDANIVKALTRVCEKAQAEVEGFEWLTHRVDFTAFPGSLIITCVFATDEQRQKAQAAGLLEQFQNWSQRELLKVGVRLRDVRNNLRFDSEESCVRENAGDWACRLERFVAKQPHRQPR